MCLNLDCDHCFKPKRANVFPGLVRHCILTFKGRHYFKLETIWLAMSKRGQDYYKVRRAHLVKVMIERLDGRMELMEIGGKTYYIFSIREFTDTSRSLPNPQDRLLSS